MTAKPTPLVTLGLILALVLLGPAATPDQQGGTVRIEVLNGQNGRPITGECLNIGFGALGPGAIIAPTDDRGVVTLRIGARAVTADPAPRSRCGKTAVLGPVHISAHGLSLLIAGDYFIPCQEYASYPVHIDPRGAGPATLSAFPRYSVAEILRLGVVASNTCGKVTIKPKPGELIFFERPRTFWERMRH